MKILANVFLAIAVFSAASIASAEYCSGKIIALYVERDGGLVIHGDWQTSYTAICDVDSTWKGVSASTCKAWLTVVTTAKVSNNDVVLKYPSHTCSNLPVYDNSPAPAYLMLRE